LGLGDEQALPAQLVQRDRDQALACPSELGQLTHIALAIAMPPDTGSNRAQAMSDMVLLIVEQQLLADCLFNETVLTCSW
jgi:hypothetical protein